MTTPLPRILCVDDELNVLRGLARNIRKHFDVHVVTSGREALNLLGEDPSIEVICSDYRMPGMDGAQLLSCARQRVPDVTRVLLSGQADLEAMAKVVNSGGIHRFLMKPCPPAELVEALADAVELHRLRTAERSLLEGTLVQSVRALTGSLALARPAAFGHCQRVTHFVSRLLEASCERSDWRVHTAASLAGLGFLAIPEELVEAWLSGQLHPDDAGPIERVPFTSAELIGEVPRLREVVPILHATARPTAESPWASRVIALARDYVLLVDRGCSQDDAVAIVESDWADVDPDLVTALHEVLRERQEAQIVDVPSNELEPGMVLVSDLVTEDGTILLAHGVEITPAILERVRNYRRLFRIAEPVRVLEE
ncbi:MAG: response regulator [Myxococcota bacterium]